MALLVYVKQEEKNNNCSKQKNFKAALPITSFLMIYGLPTQQGYAHCVPSDALFESVEI